ncbi:MAG: hypothetical protein ABIK89_09550 [Planctomycetota bacterium]
MNPSSNALILADYAIIVGFFVVMLAVGLYFAGRIRDAKDYFAGGKQVPWWLSSISFWMSSFSAFAFVAHSRLAYEHGCVPITMWWLGAVVTIITAHLVAARWRRVATTSPMEFVEERYGLGMRQSLSCLVAPLFVLPAMAASIFLPGLEDPEQVYGLVCRELLPAGMLGMLVAAIFSATMSSLSSDYNAVASVLTTDVYRRLVAPRASDRDCVLAGRLFTLVVGLATMVLALWMVIVGEDLSLFDMMVVIFVVLGPPTSIPVIVGLMSRRVSNAGAICGVATGMLAVGCILVFLPRSPC